MFSIYELSMSANFTSGWLGNNERAWHGLGVVTEGTLPAREAFETADALFTVEKRELQFPSEFRGYPGSEYKPAGVYGVVRTDTETLLGVVSKQYEIVQNDSLLRMAEFIREEVDMDCVIVLSDGAKVCFTATLKWCGDGHRPWRHRQTTHRRLPRTRRQDWLWCKVHQRPCCLSKHTDCSMRDSGAHSSITHKNGANNNFDALINSIDVARQDFVTECELMREFSRASMGVFSIQRLR